MTIKVSSTLKVGSRRAARIALVIIVAGIFGRSTASESGSLTTPPVPILTTVVIDGSSAYQPPQLFAAYRDQLGQPITREGARAIVDALTALYEGEGFVRPEITLDNSLTGSGVLRVGVFEPHVSNVIFEGDVGRYRAQLEGIGARLEQSRPLRKNDVSDALRSMRQIAGLAITASTRRDANQRNAFELVVSSEFSPVDGVVRVNNRGTDEVGPAFLLGQLFVNGLLGRQDKVGLIFAAATEHDEYLGGGLYVDAGLGSAGTRANALLFRSRSAPNEAGFNLDHEYQRARASLRISHPLHQETTSSLHFGFGFEAEDLVIDSDGVELREDRLRIVETGLRASWRAAVTQYSGSLTVRKGLTAFGAGLQAPDLVDDPRRADFLLTQLSATVYRRFATDWTVRLDVLAQHSGYVLPDSERFKIGGDRLGRGFEVVEIAGDRGLGGKLELRRDLLSTDGVFGRLSAYGFYDIGGVWKQDLPGRESAATAGTGLAIQGSTLTGYLELAAPLTGTDIEGKREPSVFAELSYRF